MAMEKNDITLPVRRFIHISICKSYKFIQDYPHAFILFILLFLLHKLFPSLFLLFLSHSPVFALTSLLLGALLYYGEKEPNFDKIKERELNREIKSQKINTECKSIEDTLYHSLANASSSDSESEGKSERKPQLSEEIKAEWETDSHRISSDSESDEKSENNISQNRSCETERFRRLTSLIERRRARMSIRHEIKRSLKDPETETLVDDSARFKDRVSPVTAPKWNPNDQNEGFMSVPGSAPSVLWHRSPFEPGWNRNGLTGQRKVSRLDPFFVTEMDKESLENGSERRLNGSSDGLSLNGNDENMLDLKGEYSIDEIEQGKGEFNDGISVVESEEETIFTRDLEQNSANVEGESANPYSDTILLSEFLNLCSFKTRQPIKDQIETEPESPSEFLNLCSSEISQPIKDQIESETETPSETIETLIAKENVENAPDQFSNGEIMGGNVENAPDRFSNGEIKEGNVENAPDQFSNGEIMVGNAENASVQFSNGEIMENIQNAPDQFSNGEKETANSTIEKIQIEENEVLESESVKEINSIVKQIQTENGSVSKEKVESTSVEMGEMGFSESEIVISKQNGDLKDETDLILEETAEQAAHVLVLKKKDELDLIETGQTGLSESEMEISDKNENLSDETGLNLGETGRICQGGLQKSPLSNSISSNLKKLRKQNMAVETSSSSSNSD